jgi:WD40 repeat protein
LIRHTLVILGVLCACLFPAHAQDTPEIFPQLGHPGGSVAFSPDGHVLASGADSVTLWDVGSGRELRTLTGHSGNVNSVAFSPDGRILASGSQGNMLTLWDVASGRELRTLAGHSGNINSVAFSPDGRLLASGSDDKTVKLWDLVSGHVLRVLRHPDEIETIAFSPDGHILASGSYNGNVKFWDVATGRELRTLTGHSGNINSVAFSPDGHILAAGDEEQTLKLWDVASGRELRTLSNDRGNDSVAFSPDGRILASSSRGPALHNTIKLWDVASGRVLRALSGASSIAFSPDGRILASGSDDHTIKLWDVASGNVLCDLGAHSAIVKSVAFSPDGHILAAGDEEQTLKLWDVASGRVLRTLGGHSDTVNSVAFSPDGRVLASGSQDGKVKFWDVASGRELRTLDVDASIVFSVAFSPDGRVLAVGGESPKVELWDVASGRLLGTLSGHSELVNNHGNRIPSVAFSSAGRLLASGSKDKTVKLWDATNGRVLRTLSGHSADLSSVAFSPDGRILASGSDDHTIKLWDVASGRALHTLTGHSGGVESVAFSPDGRILASGSDDHTIKLWDVASGRALRTLAGHSGTVESVAFSPDGHWLASGGDDGATRIWDPSSGNLKVSFVAFNDTSYLAITPEGYFDASSAAAEENLNIRVGNRVFPIAAYRVKFYRPDLVKLSLEGKSLKELGFAGIDSVKLAPIIELVDLPASTAEPKLSVNLRITDAGGGIGQVRVYLNGTAVDQCGGASPSAASGIAPIIRSCTVNLDRGPNVLLAEADNADNNMHGSSGIASIIANLAAAPRGKLYALVVGIQEFNNPKYNLTYAVKDAQLFAETLEKYSAPLFEARPQIKLLTTPAETTRDSVTAALETMKSAMDSDLVVSDDVFVFYIASHGVIADGEYFIATSNVDAADRLRDEALSKNDLTALLADVPATKKVVLIDACHAQPLGDALQAALLNRGNNEKTAATIMARDIGLTVLAAATSDEEALEGYKNDHGDYHGLFTSIVTEGLAGSADLLKHGIVTNYGLTYYVGDKVPHLAENLYKHEQHPTADANGPSFELAKVR